MFVFVFVFVFVYLCQSWLFGCALSRLIASRQSWLFGCALSRLIASRQSWLFSLYYKLALEQIDRKLSMYVYLCIVARIRYHQPKWIYRKVANQLNDSNHWGIFCYIYHNRIGSLKGSQEGRKYIDRDPMRITDF